MTWILWVKALHIAFMVAWFAGIFYLPRLFVYHAMNAKPAVHEQFCVMERRLLFFVTPKWSIVLITETGISKIFLYLRMLLIVFNFNSQLGFLWK